MAQDAGPRPDLKTPEIEATQQPEPTQQGTRPVHPLADNPDAADLQTALTTLYRAPPALDGTPMPRPNEFASNPEDPHEQSRSADPNDLTSQEVK